MKSFLSASLFVCLANPALAGDCKQLCDPAWWSKASDAEIQYRLKNDDLEATNATGQTPLLAMAMFGNSVAVEKLLESGAFVNAGLMSGNTALFFATWSCGSSEIIKALIDAGAMSVSYSFDGETPLTKAAISCDLDSIQHILERAADKDAYVNHLPDKGGSALMRAARYQTPDVVDYLLDAGADVDLTDQRGKGVSYYALGNKKLVGSEALRRLTK